MQVAERVKPLQKSRTSEGNSSPDSKLGKVWIPSWTENTKRHAVATAAHRNSIELWMNVMQVAKQASEAMANPAEAKYINLAKKI